MANNVFANGLEIACKAADGKAIAAFPDPCFSPPSPPAGWIPVPYPNTAYAKDTANASKTVMISGKPVMKKDVSYFKKSTGNEPAAGPKGIVTGVKKGKAYFTSWSMNVKVEGKNVDRHTDMTTHNHGSSSNTAPWYFADSQVVGNSCDSDKEKVEDACGKNEENNPSSGSKNWKEEHCQNLETKPNKDNAGCHAEKAVSNDCLKARKCMLVPFGHAERYSKNKKDNRGCCRGQTGHHLIPKSYFGTTVTVEKNGKKRKKFIPGKSICPKYSQGKAPTVCVEGTNNAHGSHGELHTKTDIAAEAAEEKKGNFNYNTARDAMVSAHQEQFPESSCSSECLKAQLDSYHKETCKQENKNFGKKKLMRKRTAASSNDVVEAFQ